ncbi:MAG: hypothetical protein HY362_04385 [Candidatus Aenigmarchaeota archaeon]|nr:hypothetical protein [Candidatus Aenigmarchaeota archaeon]
MVTTNRDIIDNLAPLLDSPKYNEQGIGAPLRFVNGSVDGQLDWKKKGYLSRLTWSEARRVAGLRGEKLCSLPGAIANLSFIPDGYGVHLAGPVFYRPEPVGTAKPAAEGIRVERVYMLKEPAVTLSGEQVVLDGVNVKNGSLVCKDFIDAELAFEDYRLRAVGMDDFIGLAERNGLFRRGELEAVSIRDLEEQPKAEERVVLDKKVHFQFGGGRWALPKLSSLGNRVTEEGNNVALLYVEFVPATEADGFTLVMPERKI